jgi:hypothetical protein
MNDKNDAVEQVWLQIIDIKLMALRNRIPIDLSQQELRSLFSAESIKLSPSSNIVYMDKDKNDYF